MKPPAIILVRPQLGENIGAVARAMHNFGLTDLRLVAPKNGWPNPRAIDMAASGISIVEKAKVYKSVAEAMHGIRYALATSARGRDMVKPVLEPCEAARVLHAQAKQGRTAILFGPERTGLENEDVILAEALVTIPTSPENPSLNLSQAAVVLAYEWFRAQESGIRDQNKPNPAPGPLAPKQTLQGLFDQLEEYLEAVNHFRTRDKKKLMWQNLRSIFMRAHLNEQEVRTLRGVIRALYLRRKQ